MSLRPILQDRLRLPVVASPIIVSDPELVMAQSASGIAGSFPALDHTWRRTPRPSWSSRVPITINSLGARADFNEPVTPAGATDARRRGTRW